MLSNAYFLAKFRFDTAENEPAKNLQNFRKMHFRKMHFSKMHFSKKCILAEVEADLPRVPAPGRRGVVVVGRGVRRGGDGAEEPRVLLSRTLEKIYRRFAQKGCTTKH